MIIGIPRSPHFQFLLSALLWLAATLGIWWMLLLDPMLSGLRSVSEWVLHLLPEGSGVAQITIQPDGDWLFRIPLPEAIGKLESTQKIFGREYKDGKPVKVRSVKFPMERKYPALFTVGLPFFCALWFAAPHRQNSLRAMLLASAALGTLAVISLVSYAFFAAAAFLHFKPPGVQGYLLNLGDFIVLNVIPFAGPLLLAIGLNRGIQQLVFEGAGAPLAPAKIAPQKRRGSHGKRIKAFDRAVR